MASRWQDALADLHQELLEGLHRWRARLAECPELQGALAERAPRAQKHVRS